MPDMAWQTCPKCGAAYRSYHDCPKKKTEDKVEKKGGK